MMIDLGEKEKRIGIVDFHFIFILIKWAFIVELQYNLLFKALNWYYIFCY